MSETVPNNIAPDNDERARKIRRNTILLVALAVGIYALFIASTVLGWRQPQ